MSAADPATLAAIQRVTKRCLAEIDRVCTLLDIRYVAYGGTAIGAVRHQGFIPWDDDMDFGIPRDHFGPPRGGVLHRFPRDPLRLSD